MADPVVLGFLVVFALVGLHAAIWPYKVARSSERFDAIGSKRSRSEVEPADWNVTFTRYIGLFGTLLSVIGLAVGLT